MVLSVAVIANLVMASPVFAEVRMMPYKQDSGVTVDGIVEEGEYENHFTEEEIGVQVFWEHDNTHMHVGLVSPGEGWVAIGFVSTKVSVHEGSSGGANMILAGIEDNGSLQAYDLIGSGYAHDYASVYSITEIAGTKDNGVVVEFKYPLDFSDSDSYDISKLEPGNWYTYMLAYHASSASLTYPGMSIPYEHTSAAFGDFYMGENASVPGELPPPPGYVPTSSKILLAITAALVILGALIIWKKIMR